MEKRIDWSKKPATISFLGNESFFKKKSLDRAVASLPDFHIEEHEGGLDDDEIKSTLLSAPSPFFTMKKLVVIKEANKFGNKDLLKKYCENPSDDKIVILMSSDRGRDAKWFKELPVTHSLDCQKISDWNLGEWLVSEAKRNGYSLKKDFAEAIVMNVGTHLHSLANELSKLYVYCGDRRIIQSKDIQDVLYSHSSLSPFEVIRYWGLGNKNISLQFLIRHFEKTPETQWIRSELVMIKGFSDRVESLLRARSMKNAGLGADAISTALGISKWLYGKNMADQVNTRTVRELTKAYRSICDVESKSKMGKSGRLLLQSFIIHN